MDQEPKNAALETVKKQNKKKATEMNYSQPLCRETALSTSTADPSVIRSENSFVLNEHICGTDTNIAKNRKQALVFTQSVSK